MKKKRQKRKKRRIGSSEDDDLDLEEITQGSSEDKILKSFGPFTLLPQELINYILKFLDLKSFVNFSTVNTTFQGFVNDQRLWFERYKEDFPDQDFADYYDESESDTNWRLLYIKELTTKNEEVQREVYVAPPTITPSKAMLNVPLLVVLFPIVLLLSLIPFVIPCHHTVVYFARIYDIIRDTRSGVVAKLSSYYSTVIILAVHYLVDVSLGLIPQILFYITLILFYRFPYLVWRLRRKTKKLGPNNVPISSLILAGQVVCVILDVIVVLFLFPFILLTCFRLPELFRKLRKLSYLEFGWGKHWRVFLDTFLSIWSPCMMEIRVLFIVLGVVAFILISPLTLVLLIVPTHVTVVLIYEVIRSVRDARIATDKIRGMYLCVWRINVYIVFNFLVLILWEIAAILCSCIIAWFIVSITIYRLPLTIIRIKLILDTTNHLDVLSRSLKASVLVFIQCLSIIVDILVLLFFVIPILLTCVRVVPWAKQLHNVGYVQALGDYKFWSISWQQFCKIITPFAP